MIKYCGLYRAYEIIVIMNNIHDNKYNYNRDNNSNI